MTTGETGPSKGAAKFAYDFWCAAHQTHLIARAGDPEPFHELLVRDCAPKVDALLAPLRARVEKLEKALIACSVAKNGEPMKYDAMSEEWKASQARITTLEAQLTAAQGVVKIVQTFYGLSSMYTMIPNHLARECLSTARAAGLTGKEELDKQNGYIKDDLRAKPPERLNDPGMQVPRPITAGQLAESLSAETGLDKSVTLKLVMIGICSKAALEGVTEQDLIGEGFSANEAEQIVGRVGG